VRRSTPLRDRNPGPDPPATRRRIVVGVTAAGAGLLGVSLSSAPGTPRFYGLTLSTAATWIVGGLASGPLHRGWSDTAVPRRLVVAPVLLAVGTFPVFYACALVARRIPPLNREICRVLRYAHQGDRWPVLATTLLSGAAEEIFFRGAVYTAAGTGHPVAVSTAVYALSTTATRNPALVLAAGALGTVFGLQRRATGGLQAPVLTHLTWSALTLQFLPPLFPDPDA
jgi:membrane protease YdiL (CAAX protease family)